MLANNHFNVLRFLVALRNAGQDARFHIRHKGRVTDPVTGDSTPQFICAALVNYQEINCDDHTIINTFLTLIREREIAISRGNEPCNTLHKGFLYHNRIVVILNFDNEHGETRLFDPYRNLIAKIVQDHVTRYEKQNNKEIKIADPASELLQNLIRDYQESFGSMDSAVFLLFSHYIPCDIAFHECSRVLHDYVEKSNYTICVSYEYDFIHTDRWKAHANMIHKNLVVYPRKSFYSELQRNHWRLQRDLLLVTEDDNDLWNTDVDKYTQMPTTVYMRRQYKRTRHKKRAVLKLTISYYDEEAV